MTMEPLTKAATVRKSRPVDMNPAHWLSRSLRFILRLALYLFLLDIAYVFLYPFLYMLFNSVKSPSDLMNTAVNWVPTSFHYQNYLLAWQRLNYLRGFVNSTVITLLATTGHVLAASFIGYGFARTTAPGRKAFLLILLLSIIVPSQVISIPLYVQFGAYGWNDSFLPMIIPTFFGFGLRGGIFVFIFRQYYMTLPKELETAAYIDGCGTYRSYYLIIFPLSRTMVLVSLIISSVWHWNDYTEPTLFISSDKLRPISSMLPILNNASKSAFESLEALINGTAVTQSVVLAGIVLVMLPTLILYMVLQRNFIAGIERTGLVE